MTDALNPCPLCRYDECNRYHTGGASPSIYVKCLRCGCKGPLEQWQNRAPVPVPDGVRRLHNSTKARMVKALEANRGSVFIRASNEGITIQEVVAIYSGPEAAEALKDE